MSEERPTADASLGFTYRNHMGTSSGRNFAEWELGTF